MGARGVRQRRRTVQRLPREDSAARNRALNRAQEGSVPMADDYWSRRAELGARLAQLRRRLGEPTLGLPPEHAAWAPGHPLAPEEHRALQSQIQALKRQLLSPP